MANIPNRCHTCDFISIPRVLKKHEFRTHSQVKQEHQCHQCDYNTYDKTQIMLHYKSQKAGVTFECDTCQMKLCNKRAVTLHKNRVHGRLSKLDKNLKDLNKHYIKKTHPKFQDVKGPNVTKTQDFETKIPIIFATKSKIEFVDLNEDSIGESETVSKHQNAVHEPNTKIAPIKIPILKIPGKSIKTEKLEPKSNQPKIEKLEFEEKVDIKEELINDE